MSTELETLKRIFGDEFVKSYLEAKAKSEKISEEIAQAVLRQGIEAMKSTNEGRATVSYQGAEYDVILVQTPGQGGEVKETSAGNFKVGMVWPWSDSPRGPWISVFTGDKELAQRLAEVPNRLWFVVGRLREREFEGLKTYSIRILAAKPADEVA